MNLICRVLDHRYRNRVPEVFCGEVYCSRCGRVFGSFDSPFARALWQNDINARRQMMGISPDPTGQDDERGES
jgi:hypothetical protein